MSEKGAYQSLDELEADKTKWTLASDQKLLNTLQQTSDDTLNSIQRINDKFESFVDETNKCTTNVDNLMTSILLLSNSKFVENRVYDEDINDIQKNNPSMYQKKPEQSKAQSDLEILDKLKESIHFGSRILEIKLGFETTSSQPSDRMNFTNNLYCNHDNYSQVPLPNLIGSEEYIKNIFVGLRKSPQSSPIPASKDKFDYRTESGEIPDAIYIPANESRSPQPSEDDFEPFPSISNNKPKNGDIFNPEESDEDDDLFSTSRVPPINPCPGTSASIEPLPDIMSQLTSQIKNRIEQNSKDSDFESSTASSPQEQVNHERARTVPSLPVIPKSNVGRSLFDSDDDSDDGLFSKPLPPSRSTRAQTSEVKSDNASTHSDSAFSFNGGSAGNSNIDVRSKSSASSTSTLSLDVNNTKSRMKSIFGSDDDDDDDIFKVNKLPTKSKTEVIDQKKKTSTTEPLFAGDDDEDDEDGDDLFGGKSSQEFSKKPAVSIKKSPFSANVISELNVKLAKKPIDSIPEVLPTLPEVKSAETVQVKPKKLSKAASLFDSDDDGDLFGSSKASKSLNKSQITSMPAQESLPSKAPVLDVPTKKVSLPKIPNLFDDDEDNDGEDDLFGSTKSSSKFTVLPEPAPNRVEILEEPQVTNKSVESAAENSNATEIPKKDSVPASPKASPFKSNFLNELNSTLSKKNSVLKQVESSEDVQDPVVETVKPIQEPQIDTDFNQILKSKAKLNSRRKRRPPTRASLQRAISDETDSTISEEVTEDSTSEILVEEEPTQPSPVIDSNGFLEHSPELDVLEEATVSQPEVEKPKEIKLPPKKVSLFSDDSDDDIFGRGPAPALKVVKAPLIPQPVSKPKPTPSFFDSSDSDDAEKKPAVVEVVQKKPAAKKSIFDDDSDDDLFKS